MSEYKTEDEQVELIKGWWKEYGLSTIIGTIIAIAIVLGWQYYSHYQLARRDQASLIYETMIAAGSSGDIQHAQQNANTLIHNYKRTPYATLAALWLAKSAAEQNHLDVAVQELQWVMQHGHDKQLQDIARLRLARVYLAENNSSQASATLKNFHSKAYDALNYDIQGDIAMKQGNTAEARNAYQQALKLLPQDSPTYGLLQGKLANLPAA